MDKKKRIKELVEILNKAAKSYYVDAVEIMPNIELEKFYINQSRDPGNFG